MALKMIQLLFCSVLSLTATCQPLTNGNFVCGKEDTEEVGNYDACSKKDYKSALRYQNFGIDCCIEEARESMNEFFKLFQKVDFGSLEAETVSYKICMKQYLQQFNHHFSLTFYWKHALH